MTPYIVTSEKNRVVAYKNSSDYSQMRWTVDEPADLEVVNSIFESFAPRKDFSWKEVIELSNANPNIFEANNGIIRNEGASMNTGQKYWKRATNVIPGGNMLLSKRSEMMLPEAWPSYYTKAEGCKVWDLDGNCYTDTSLMGVGTNTLGYGRPEVDKAVLQAVSNGNMSTLNCPEEVLLAEKLVELHPWAEMVRFARTGGEACSIAVRIARAASGRDKVAFCGYHGWQDWYLATNLSKGDNLQDHLLPGLQPNGVPSSLMGSALPFHYNEIEELENIVAEGGVGVVMMEVSHSELPNVEFLRKVQKVCRENGIVLIFDEISSGFRQSLGGIHLNYDLEPDIAVFGKALGNAIPLPL